MRILTMNKTLVMLLAFSASACSTMPQTPDRSDSSPYRDSDLQLAAAMPSIPMDPAADSRVTSSALDPLGEVAVGEVATLKSGNPLRVSRARVIGEYSAASGRLCRRVTEPRVRLVCQEEGEHWSLVRGLATASR